MGGDQIIHRFGEVTGGEVTGVDGDQELADMRRPTLVVSECARLRAEGRTGQGGSKDFHEKGDIGALATAGGQQRAFQPGGRVGRRLSVPVLRPADRDCLAAIAAQDLSVLVTALML